MVTYYVGKNDFQSVSWELHLQSISESSYFLQSFKLEDQEFSIRLFRPLCIRLLQILQILMSYYWLICTGGKIWVAQISKLLNKKSIPEFISGAYRNRVKLKSVELIDDLRNYFTTSEESNKPKDFYSINLQRGRDHGVGSLEDIRAALGLQPKNISLTFTNQFGQKDKIEQLYRISSNVDMWLALIGQQTQPMSALGEIGKKYGFFK